MMGKVRMRWLSPLLGRLGSRTLLTLCAALFAIVVYPLSKKVAGGEQQSRAAASALTAARRDYDAARATVKGKGQADQELQKFYTDVLPPDLSAARRATFLRIEQLAQLRIAEQLTQLRLIHRQRLRAPFGKRRVAVVDVVGHIAEEQGGRKRRRRLGIDRRQAQRARLQPAQHVDKGRHVEMIAKHLAIGFEQRRERAEARGDGEEIGGTLALLP